MAIEEKHLTTTESVEEQEDAQSIFSLQNIFTMLVLNWQWFLLSLFIFICGALIYLRYTTPVYRVSAKMLIKEDQSNRRRSAGQMLSNMQDFGFLSNSEGIENEMEILQSTVLSRDAVRRLKLYTEYRSEGRIKDQLVYRRQPVTVDLDPESLDSLDLSLLERVRVLNLTIHWHDGYQIDGCVVTNGIEGAPFSKHAKTLPASFQTEMGTVTLTANAELPQVSENSGFKQGRALYVTIMPPMLVARRYARSMDIKPTSKLTSIAEITLQDENVRRGIDFLNTLALSYNDQANADKNEIALKTEEFINGRLEKIDAELGSTEDALENYKRRHNVTSLQLDASQTLQQASQYSARLAEANSQLELLDYLRQYVDNPDNRYEVFPSNVGLTDAASVALIGEFNKTVQERNRLLKAASEQAPQVLTLTATLNELRASIRQALLQARRTADIQRQSIQAEYAKYQSRVGNTPEQERVLTQIGRQQEVKSGLYLMLLQKREENSISLAATADKGRLIDEVQYNGKVSPRGAIILLAAIVLGLGIPLVIFYLLQLLSYRLEGHEDLARLTSLPIVADVPVASESVKTTAGIVVQANKNNQIDEIFRSLRTNIQFMLKENEKVILFTSSTSGEGKTFLAANLAVSFALLGKRVVLCGLDIRKPALGRLFHISDRERGITPLLVKEKVTADALDAQITPSGVNDHLDLLLAGPTPPNPTELLARQNLADVVSLLEQTYDYIILDTAPVGLVTDTLQIARYANVCCYVCRADYTPKSNIGLVNSLAEEGKLPNACVVLNGVDMSKKKYGYYYGYGKYGKYGRYGYGRYGYGRYGYGNYGNYGNYANSHYGSEDDNSIKK